jgi:hypothetical protein
MIGTFVAAMIASSPPRAELTVYNQGFGLVKEVRVLNLRRGRQSVAITDVASGIEPTSVGFHSLSSSSGFRVHEQNYQYDLISTDAILSKSVGQRVRFERSFGGHKEMLEGTLLNGPKSGSGDSFEQANPDNHGLVIRTIDGRIIMDPGGDIEVEQIPAGLIGEPTLLWEVESETAHVDNVELSYITNGLSWSADYVLSLDGFGRADLQGWVSIDNKSGATWKDATLKLLAGDVHRINEAMPVASSEAKAISAFARRSTGFEEESLFEYHLYTLQRPATVRNNETKQLSLLTGHNIPIRKRLIVDSIGGRYCPSEGEIGTGAVMPQVRLEFRNDKASGLGMPLPKGKIMVTQRDKSGSVQLLGEDNIGHTPKNELVSIDVGKSFDVVSFRRRLAFKHLGPQEYREEFEVELRNRKDNPQSVEVFERHYGDWRITRKSQDFVKPDSNTALFTVSLKPNEVKKVTYTVETKW